MRYEAHFEGFGKNFRKIEGSRGLPSGDCLSSILVENVANTDLCLPDVINRGTLHERIAQ
jgi:hypothetical protein